MNHDMKLLNIPWIYFLGRAKDDCVYVNETGSLCFNLGHGQGRVHNIYYGILVRIDQLMYCNLLLYCLL